jgi:ATP-dependent DNA ligase
MSIKRSARNCGESVMAGVDLRALPWEERRERLELLARAFDVPLELSPVIEPTRGLATAMADGRLEGIVLKDRTSPYRDGSRAGWAKIKDASWYAREAWRFDRRIGPPAGAVSQRKAAFSGR